MNMGHSFQVIDVEMAVKDVIFSGRGGSCNPITSSYEKVDLKKMIDELDSKEH